MPDKVYNFDKASVFNQMLKDLKDKEIKDKVTYFETDEARFDPQTPDDVIITRHAREPAWDATLGEAVTLKDTKTRPRHRLVTIGDSLTQGFQSGAIFNTDISYPAIIAYEMGWYDNFRHPSYRGFGGLPLNIELLIRELEKEFGSKVDWWELATAIFKVRHYMAQVEDWWERGPGSNVQQMLEMNHNLAIYGWDLRDTLSRNANICQAAIKKPKDQLFKQIVENANERTALRVLNYLPGKQPRNSLTPLQQAAALSKEGTLEDGTGDGIETLIVLLGANNALPSILNLKVKWSEDGKFTDLNQKSDFTVWRPIHFESELNELVAEVNKIKARHVIFGTVPHVTIVPIARGVSKDKDKVRPGSRYFSFYTRPWITDSEFDSKDDPCITENQARAIDSAIDQYNYCIQEAVRAARKAGKDWYILDVGGVLDRLACRRYIDDVDARPPWWRKYELPPELAALTPSPDSKFFTSDKTGLRMTGGLFSLDGVHPTTISYGILAQEFINVMQRAGVKFYLGDGKTERDGPVRVNFARLIAQDTLIADPPRSIASDLKLVGWVDERVDVIRRLLRAGF